MSVSFVSPARAWDTENLPDQSGKTAVVTGANSGLGFFASAQLAGAGARVVLACRNMQRADAAAHAIRGRYPHAQVDVLELDTSSLGSVDGAAAEIRSLGRLDVLIENAGMVHPPRARETSIDGHEMVLATNIIGHFALAARVYPVLAETPGARLVTVGSLASRLSGLALDNLQLTHGYDFWTAYAQSKIAVQAFGFELDRRLRAAGVDVSALVAHPGYSITGRSPRVPGVNEPGRGTVFVDSLQAAFTQGKDRGAWPIVRAAVDPAAVGGQYWGPLYWTKGRPVLQEPTPMSSSSDVGGQLWERLEDYAGVRFTI